MTRWSSKAAPRAVILCAVLLLGAGTAVAQPAPFNAFILPELSEAEVGDTVTVTFEVDSTAMQFNGYRVEIRYDPQIVDFLDVEEGDHMDTSCGFNWFLPIETDSTIILEHVVLCGGLSLDGPGELSTYRFEAVADGISPLEIISDPDMTFTDAGEWVNPSHPTFPRQVTLTGGAIQVGPSMAVRGAAPARDMDLLYNVPNPFNPSTEIRFRTGGPGPVALEIWDVTGHLRWRCAWPHLPAGEQRVRWSGRSATGALLPSGVYAARLVTPLGITVRKLSLVR